ncbi:MAG: nuclear transport factor 2 family protein [Flavobacteriales bacterium]|nr:nuclear transport factor 2 family protein [Flavobacteriales bacterium]
MRLSGSPWYLLAFWPLWGCSPPGSGAGQAVRTAMDRQVQAWNAGDIPGFMEAYAEEVCFISAAGRTCGKALVTKRYQARYPDAAAMGRLEFDGLEVLSAGPGHAWCTGRWHLLRTSDTLSGGFSLLWQQEAQGWRIIRDHTY